MAFSFRNPLSLMNAKEFYEAFADQMDISVTESKEICSAVFELLSASISVLCLENDDRLYIKGLGTFKGKEVGAHRVGNLAGGEPHVIPPTRKVQFDFSPANEKYLQKGV